LSDKAITAARNSFDEPGIGGIVAQSLSKLVNGCVQPMFELDEGVFRPERTAQVLASHNGPSCREEQYEDTERLFLQTDSGTSLSQFHSLDVKLEDAEPENAACHWCLIQKTLSSVHGL
jgi:hypothetical protein